MPPDIKIIEHAFLEAMANGYAQGAPMSAIAELSGSHATTFKWGDCKVIDCYFTTPYSDKSTGQTMIWHKDVPVWVMHYGGAYAKIAIPFLKECLSQAYVEDRQFYGGRGRHCVRGESLTYFNNMFKFSFYNFKGMEKIFDSTGECLGYHWYHGMSLLKHN